MLIMSLETIAFVVEDFTPNAPDPDKEMKQQCPLCNDVTKLKHLRDHVGRHILLCSYGVKEHDLLNAVRFHPLAFTSH